MCGKSVVTRRRGAEIGARISRYCTFTRKLMSVSNRKFQWIITSLCQKISTILDRNRKISLAKNFNVLVYFVVTFFRLRNNEMVPRWGQHDANYWSSGPAATDLRNNVEAVLTSHCTMFHSSTWPQSLSASLIKMVVYQYHFGTILAPCKYHIVTSLVRNEPCLQLHDLNMVLT